MTCSKLAPVTTDLLFFHTFKAGIVYAQKGKKELYILREYYGHFHYY